MFLFVLLGSFQFLPFIPFFQCQQPQKSVLSKTSLCTKNQKKPPTPPNKQKGRFFSLMYLYLFSRFRFSFFFVSPSNFSNHCKYLLVVCPPQTVTSNEK
ncbi:MAG: hypothetical protein J3R72DRAFT_45212 [Linnemannia gamsii]|nr:MAG: hypothetical protein J3R72DRAFT_45212 [Linnemannia gamsii]